MESSLETSTTAEQKAAQQIADLPVIQWYPGHIAKVERALKEHLKLVDVVIEVVDARIPETTMNPRLRKQYEHKPVLLLLNKSDFADNHRTKQWQSVIKNRYQDSIASVMTYDALSGKLKQRVIEAIIKLGEPIQQKLIAKGRKRRPLRVLVAGMPNVGKSTIINSLVAQKKVKTGHKAGVTRTTQWVRIHPQVELLDSPGIIPPSLHSPEAGALLACVHSVGEASFDEESVARYLLNKIDSLYPGLCAQHFNLVNESPLTIQAIAEARNYKLKGFEWDLLRAARAVLHDFRTAKLGRFTLNIPELKLPENNDSK